MAWASGFKSGDDVLISGVGGYRLRRWPNIETALGECPVFAGMFPDSNLCKRWVGDHVLALEIIEKLTYFMVSGFIRPAHNPHTMGDS